MEDINKCTLEQNIEFYAIPQNLNIGFKVYVELTFLDKDKNILGKKVPNNVVVEKNSDKEKYGNSEDIILYKFKVKDLSQALNINPNNIAYVTGWIDANNDKQVSIDYDEVSTLEVVKCYCLEQGIVNKSCYGEGNNIQDEHFRVLAKELGVEKEVLQAVAEVESGPFGSFQKGEPKRATILYERHYFRDFITEFSSSSNKDGSVNITATSSLNGEQKQKTITITKEQYKNSKDRNTTIRNAKSASSSYFHNKSPDLIGPAGFHKGSSKVKLEEAKKLNESFAIQSCSWGKFQVMGSHYKLVYKTPQELEKAQNQCELQHLKLFKEFLKDKKLTPDLKNRNWDNIARKYNGSDYKIYKYDTKMEDAYNKLKGKK